MIESLVMTIIGGDRPGLVELVAACVADHGGKTLTACHVIDLFSPVREDYR